MLKKKLRAPSPTSDKQDLIVPWARVKNYLGDPAKVDMEYDAFK